MKHFNNATEKQISMHYNMRKVEMKYFCGSATFLIYDYYFSLSGSHRFILKITKISNFTSYFQSTNSFVE